MVSLDLPIGRSCDLGATLRPRVPKVWGSLALFVEEEVVAGHGGGGWGGAEG